MYDLKLAVRDARAAFLRFPVVVVFALLITVVLQMLIGLKERSDDWDLFMRLLLTCGVAIPFFTGIRLLAESRQLSVKGQVFIHLAGLVAMAAFYLYMDDGFPAYFPYQFIPVILSAHLLVSIAPFIGMNTPWDFWAFNIRLFSRLLSSLLHATILNSGLALAMLSIDKLFDIGMPVSAYQRISVVIYFLFMTWFFLAGVPPRFREEESEQAPYPHSLRIFSQYILGILVLVYLVILYAFSAKVLIVQVWAKGWLAGLILVFSAVALFNYCLLWPLRTEKGNVFARMYGKWLFVLLLPLVVLLWKAIIMRTTQYGLTLNRYVVVSLAMLITFFICYFILSRKKDIRWIPAGLLIFMLLFAYGPLSGLERSLSSQINQLQELSEPYGMYKEEHIVPLKRGELMIGKDEARFCNILDYMIKYGGANRLQLVFGDIPFSQLEDIPVPDKAQRLAGLLNLNYHTGFIQDSGGVIRDFGYYRGTEQRVMNVEGFTELVHYEYFKYNHTPDQKFELQSTGLLFLGVDTVTGELVLRPADAAEARFDFSGITGDLFRDNGYECNTLLQSQLTVNLFSDRFSYKIYLSGISGKMKPDGKISELTAVSADILVRAENSP